MTFPRGYGVWREHEEPPLDLMNRLLAELVDTMDDIRTELHTLNERQDREA